jgi:hypothetical protein
VAKNLKEALLEQMGALQERGLAPGELPAEKEDESSYVQYEADGERRTGAREGEPEPRSGDGGRSVRVHARRMRPREHREVRQPRVARERRPARESRENRETPSELVGPARVTPSPSRARREEPGGARVAVPRDELTRADPGQRREGVAHPTPDRAGPGSQQGMGRRAAPPRSPRQPMGVAQEGFGGPRPSPRSDMLRRNAERIQQEQARRSDIRQLLTSYRGEEADDGAIDKFLSDLSVETGALPPLNIVVEALQAAGNADPVEAGNQVRLYYRRARSRPAEAPAVVS